MKIVKEFKEFAVKGNVVDMAVGIIIGVAFGKIVASFVADIIMPPLGILLGGMNFTEMAWVLKDASGDMPAIILGYGKFFQSVVDFMIVAFAVFMMIKGINSLKRKAKEPPAAPVAPPPPSKEEMLLTEIRDILRDKH